jgi:hypothetical protein
MMSLANFLFSDEEGFDRQVPRKPRLVSGVKGHNINEISFPGSPALWAGSFTNRGNLLLRREVKK